MSNEKLTKNERRQQAREQAKQAREAEKKREKRNRLFLQGGIVAAVLAIAAIIAVVVSQSMKPVGPGPENMNSGGATFGANLEVQKTPALPAGADRVARTVDWTKAPVDVQLYVDYMCPGCGSFEQTYGSMLETYTGNGDINLTIYPVNFLDPQSLGSNYSTRAANMFGCLVEQQPDVAFATHNLLLSEAVQPAEGTTGLSDQELLEQAEAAGAEPTTELKQCIKDQRFAGFVSANSTAATQTGLLNIAEGAQFVGDPQTGTLQDASQPQRLVSTPTVVVNGQQWVGNAGENLEQYILKLLSELRGTDDTGAEDAPTTE